MQTQSRRKKSSQIEAPALEALLDQYATLESGVRSLITSLCSPCCALCTSVCCKAEFCKESVDSAFLSLLRKKYHPPAQFSAEYGFWSETGCRLSVGRPPVCYEFFCTTLLLSPHFREYSSLIKRLSMLLTQAGRNLFGRSHLVELLDKEDLFRINRSRFEKQLSEAAIAFQEVTWALHRDSPDERDTPKKNYIEFIPLETQLAS